MASFAARILEGRGDPIYLVTGQDHTGADAWYFVRVHSKKLDAFKQAISSDHMNVEDYGAILESGYGETPPEETVAFIKQKYGSSGG